MRTKRLCMAVVLASLALATPAVAEVIGPLLPRGAVALGIQQRVIERTMHIDDETYELEQVDGALVGRWGLTEFATLSFELSHYPGGEFAGVDDVDKFYLIGGGIQAAVWRNNPWVVSIAYQFTSDLYRVAGDEPGILTATYSGQLMVQRDERIGGMAMSWFVGAAYSSHYFEEKRTTDRKGLLYHSESNYGGVLGLNLLLREHLNLTGHLLWVENPQLRYGIEYRF